LNIAGTPAGGPTIVQHVGLFAGGASTASGVATLSVAPGSQSLRIAIADLDGFRSCGVRLRCLGPLAEGSLDSSDELLRSLEVIRVRAGCHRGPFVGELPLCDALVPPSLSLNHHPALTAVEIAGMRAEVILGIAVAPRCAAPEVQNAGTASAGDHPHSLRYLRRRLADELSAAADARLPVTTSLHVELATLFAREIQERQKGVSADAL
jgi:hypothetical protein